DSETAVAEATNLAARTGDTTTLWLWFGPTNINLWRISMEADGGDPGKAVAVANHTNPSVIPAPMRHPAFHLDPAPPLAHVRKAQDAVRHLLIAERAAPQYVHSSGLVQETARYLAHQSAGPELRGLCERLGVAG